MKKLTIKDQVIAAKETLTLLKTTKELREWAIANGMDNRSAFPKFKSALLEIGISYDGIKSESIQAKADQVATNQASVIIEKSMIEKIAEEIGGKVWQKNDKNRIYTEGGNNYHYQGSWYIEFTDESCSSFEAKVYLNEGYSNNNREEYVNKHLANMEENVREAIKEISGEVVKIETKEVEYKGEEVNFGAQTEFNGNQYEYPMNFYNGCGSYYLAFNEGKLIASTNFSSQMNREDKKQLAYFQEQLNEIGIPFDKCIVADGSGCTFFARWEADVDFLKTKVYFVPASYGGKHKNIELILV